MEQPLNVSLTSLVTNKIKNEPLASCLRWYHDEYVRQLISSNQFTPNNNKFQTRIDVLNRETGRLEHKFFAEPFFYLHIINQYETHDYIVLDICIYRDASMLDCMYIEAMKVMLKFLVTVEFFDNFILF